MHHVDSLPARQVSDPTRPKIQPSPGPPRPSRDPNRLTVDRSTLIVDRDPHVSDTEPLDPPVSWWHHADVIMTSCGFHLSVAQDPRSHLSD